MFPYIISLQFCSTVEHQLVITNSQFTGFAVLD